MMPATEPLISFYLAGTPSSSNGGAGRGPASGPGNMGRPGFPESSLLLLRRFVARLLTPGAVSPGSVLDASTFAMVLVGLFELMSPAEIHLHILYVFPLAAIALHCERLMTVLEALVLSIAFQLWNFVYQALPVGPFISDGLIMVASSIVIVALARASRVNWLAMVRLAVTDWLTGLPNRRSFESAAEMEIARQRRYGGNFSLAVIDLDGFKQLNDSRGHDAGDRALKLVAEVLRKHARQTDTIARLGGDEFAVLMPSTRSAACMSLCRQLVVRIARRMADAGFGVTASVGCASFTEAPASTIAAMQKADSAMYAAKANGKDCAVSR